MKISIGNKKIGSSHPVFIIAEAGVNHNGDAGLAKKLIDTAKDAGADAVKFQTFRTEDLVTADAGQAEYQAKNVGKKESQYAMLKRLELSREDFKALKAYAEEREIVFLSTPFTVNDADFLRDLGVPAIKVGSSDTNNLPYLAHIAAFGLPILLSTGMADLGEVKEAVRTIRKAGNEDIVVLHSTTNYPTPPEEVNLLAIQTLARDLGAVAGFSDHTEGSNASIAATALGAKVIEKHLTPDKIMEGPDHAASLEPGEFKEMIALVRRTETMLGTGEKKPSPSEREIAKVARRSIIAARAISAGKVIEFDDIILKRPGTGMPPKELSLVLGKKAQQDIAKDTLFSREMFE